MVCAVEGANTQLWRAELQRKKQIATTKAVTSFSKLLLGCLLDSSFTPSY